MDEELDENKLIKLFSNIYDCKVSPEFSDEEIKNFNNYVKNMDINSIVSMFREKKDLSNEVFKDIIYSKADSLWQLIVDNSYSLYTPDMLREDFLNNLSDYEKLAVQFGDFDYQVENGGIVQWYEDDYGDDVWNLMKFLNHSDYSHKDSFMEILEQLAHVKGAIDELNIYNEWFSKDYDTRIKALDGYDKVYSNIKDSWKKYFEDYLIQNIPNEYIDKIYELDKNKSY